MNAPFRLEWLATAAKSNSLCLQSACVCVCVEFYAWFFIIFVFSTRPTADSMYSNIFELGSMFDFAALCIVFPVELLTSIMRKREKRAKTRQTYRASVYISVFAPFAFDSNTSPEFIVLPVLHAPQRWNVQISHLKSKNKQFRQR